MGVVLHFAIVLVFICVYLLSWLVCAGLRAHLMPTTALGQFCESSYIAFYWEQISVFFSWNT